MSLTRHARSTIDGSEQIRDHKLMSMNNEIPMLTVRTSLYYKNELKILAYESKCFLFSIQTKEVKMYRLTILSKRKVNLI